MFGIAHVAQLVEHFLGKGEVTGSSPVAGSIRVHLTIDFRCFLFIGFSMAKKENRFVITLRSTESSDVYTTSKNKKNTTGRLELKKYDRILRRHVIYRESK